MVLPEVDYGDERHISGTFGTFGVSELSVVDLALHFSIRKLNDFFFRRGFVTVLLLSTSVS